jgi:hypothetical protein
VVKWQNADGDGHPPMARSGWHKEKWDVVVRSHRFTGAHPWTLEGSRFPGFQTDGGCRLESSVMEVGGI